MSKSLPVMQAKAAIDKAFPGSPSPAVVVIEAKDVTAPQVTQAIANFEQKAIASGYAFSPSRCSVSKDHSVARLYVPIKGDGHNAQAVASMKALRNSVVPQTLNSTRASRRRSPARQPAPRTSARSCAIARRS